MRVEAITKLLFKGLLTKESRLLARIHLNKRVVKPHESCSEEDDNNRDIDELISMNFKPTNQMGQLLW